MNTAILGLNTDRFHKDLNQVEKNVKSLMQLDILNVRDIGMIQQRIWDTIPKYVIVR